MPEQKIRLAVLFGGRSGEHEVPGRSAASILVNLDRNRYDILPVRIGRDGVWACVPDLSDLPTVEAALRWQQDSFTTAGEVTAGGSVVAVLHELAQCDVVFPAIHGCYGEDGSLQAWLGGIGFPFVDNGVASSALSMDKEFTKKIADAEGIAVADGVVL